VKKLKIIIPIFLILITLASFYPCVKNNFTNWDDNFYVTENTAIRSLSLGNLKTIFTSFFIAHYQPVTILSYLLEYHFFKLDPFYYHLTNLILHLLNCLLVYWVIYLLTGRISVAGLTALLFGIHPLQVESVAWISERKNLLYAFFYLGAIISYLYYLSKDKTTKYYILCLALFILALLSKSVAFTLPLVLLLLDYFSSRKITLAVLIEKIPYFILSLIFGLVALLGARLSTPFHYERSYSLLDRLMGASYDIIFYLSKLFLPLKLSALYPYTPIQHNPICLHALITVVILLTGVILSQRYSKKVILGSGFFLLTVFPALRCLPLKEIIVADRYVYLASIGIFYLIAEGGIWLYQRRTEYSRLIRIFLVIALTLVVTLLGFSSWKRSQSWKDGLSLWSTVLKNYPDIFLAYDKRGEYFLTKKEYEKARCDFVKAVDVVNHYPFKPEYRYYYINLGNSLRGLGKHQEAIAVSEELIKKEQIYFYLAKINHPLGDQDAAITSAKMALDAEAYHNLAYVDDASGAKDKAIASYLQEIEINPKDTNAHFYLGALYINLNRKDEAKKEFIRAIEIDPTYKPAYINLAQVYKALGQEENLELLYKKAIANNLDFFNAYFYIGNLLASGQKDKEAILLFRRATEINPESKEAALSLGNAYLTIGRNKEAILWLKKALKLDPELAVAHHNLALAYYYAAEYDLAIKHCDKASQLGYAISPKLLELLKPHRK
jgi:tetratricopeptide (TPR) repeat protein